MARVIELPKLSPTMEEGTLVRWSIAEGTQVSVDDLLAEVETDKATMEFRSFDKGVLLKKLIPENTVARLGQPVAIFGEANEDITALLASLEAPGSPSATPPATATPTPTEATPTAVTATLTPAVATPTTTTTTTTTPTPTTTPAPAPATAQLAQGSVPGVLLAPSSPRVRRIAREWDLRLEGLAGSGPHGRVTEADLSPRTPKTQRAELCPGDIARAPSSMRKTIARRITEAKQSIPHFYLECDLAVEALAALREEINTDAAPEDKVSFNDLIVRACALSLRAVPESNASWIDGQIVQHNRADISIAVAVEDGLFTPVIRQADVKSVRAIARDARGLIARAKARKLTPEEMSHGVFSVSNLGMFGVDRFIAVINPPESMILAVGAVREVPVVRAGAVVVGKRLAVTLSCDHRVVDGALGARFLQYLRALVESPLRILA